MISFEPLRILLVKQNMKKMDFIKKCEIAPSTAAKLWKDEYVSLEVVDKICRHFGVQPDQIMKYKAGEQ